MKKDEKKLVIGFKTIHRACLFLHDGGSQGNVVPFGGTFAYRINSNAPGAATALLFTCT